MPTDFDLSNSRGMLMLFPKTKKKPLQILKVTFQLIPNVWCHKRKGTAKTKKKSEIKNKLNRPTVACSVLQLYTQLHTYILLSSLFFFFLRPFFLSPSILSSFHPFFLPSVPTVQNLPTDGQRDRATGGVSCTRLKTKTKCSFSTLTAEIGQRDSSKSF